jgi:hypothetical protein
MLQRVSTRDPRVTAAVKTWQVQQYLHQMQQHASAL